MNSPALELLEQMIIEAAAHVISVEEFEEVEGEDNDKALFDLQNERDHILFSLLHYVREYAPALEAMIKKEKAIRFIESPYLREHEYMKAIRGE